jgi:hypothetical protein
MFSSASRAVSLTAILLTATVATGQAQIGGLLKKGTNAAAGKATEAAVAQVPPQKVDVLPCAVTYDQLDALQKGLQAELDAAPAAKKEAEDRQKAAESEQKAYDKAMDDYNKKYEAYNSCRDKVENDPAARKKAEAASAKAEKESQKAGQLDEEALQAQALKAQAAAEKVANGTATAADRQVLADFQATMAGVSQTGNQAIAAQQEVAVLSKEQQARLAKCGEEPKRPASPSGLGWSPERVLLETGAKAAGMDPQTYLAVRDCAIKSANLRLTNKNYSEADANRMNGKLDAIQKTISSMRSAKVPI